MQTDGFANIVVVGLGLIGASFCAAAKEHGVGARIAGYDSDAHTIHAAKENGWIDIAIADASDQLKECVGQCDLVVLATPAQSALSYIDLLAEWEFSGVVTDTASTKTVICEHACATFADTRNFIPGHPMAGSEQNGIAGARADLFDGCHWILCPDAQTNPDSFAKLHELLTTLHARVLSMPRQDHDEALAIVSHVPHIVASSLVELACRHADEQETLFRLAAGGFKDSTRIAAGSSDLWTGIAFDNRQAVASGLREMGGIIDQFQQALEAGNRTQLNTLLENAAQARRSLPAKWVPSTDNLLVVRIPMENRSGVIAEVTTIAGKLGCNIQSIEIDHLTAHSAVLEMILTDEGDIGKLSLELVKAGFNVSLSPLNAKE